MIGDIPLVSIVVPTFNRRNYLEDCVNGLLNQTYPNYEVIIVDNNSNDGTEEFVIDRYSNTSHLRYVCERSQGISYAKNRGIKESRGEIVVFMDDDAVPIQTWLEACVRTFFETGAIGIGGRVLLDWQELSTPKWVQWAKARSFIGEIDFGDYRMEIIDWITGGNSAFHKYVFDKAGLFSTRCGRAAGKLIGGEDVEFCQRVVKYGTLFYEPNMLIYHKVSSERAKLSYVFKSAFWMGVSKVIIKRKPKPRGVSDVVGRDAIISFFSGVGYLYGRLLQILKRIEFTS